MQCSSNDNNNILWLKHNSFIPVKCLCVGVWGVWGVWGVGVGGTHTYFYVPSVKTQYKRDVIGYMVIYVTAICVRLLKCSTR